MSKWRPAFDEWHRLGNEQPDVAYCDPDLSIHEHDFRAGFLAAAPRWIQVEERLPEKNGYYLVVKDLVVTSIRWVARCWYDVSIGWKEETATVTHWQPLPTLPEGK